MSSTNRVVLDHARSGGHEGFVAVADFQHAGRGRHGRTWDAAPGSSLLMSMLLRPDLPAERLHLAAALVAVAACDACDRVCAFRPGVKWPNDLVADGAKLAGILTEVAGGAVVVGLGLNLSASSPWPAGAIAAEALAGRRVDRDELLEQLLESVACSYGNWATVASDYRRECTTIGQSVKVDLGDEAFTGIAADVSDEGHLLVDVGGCLRTVAAGDVVHLRPFPPAQR